MCIYHCYLRVENIGEENKGRISNSAARFLDFYASIETIHKYDITQSTLAKVQYWNSEVLLAHAWLTYEPFDRKVLGSDPVCCRLFYNHHSISWSKTISGSNEFHHFIWLSVPVCCMQHIWIAKSGIDWQVLNVFKLLRSMISIPLNTYV